MPRLRPLSGLDAGFLYLEASGTPMHVGSLMLLEAPKRRRFDFARAFRKHLSERLVLAPPLRRVLAEAPFGLGHPMWAEATAIDLDWHVQSMRVPRPGGPAQVAACVAKLHAQLLPRERPLWQFVVLEGLAGGELALYSRVHHALLDGQGGVALARALLDLEATPHRIEPAQAPMPHHTRAPRRRDLARTAVRATLHQFAKLVRAVPATYKVATAGGPGELVGRIRDNVVIAPRTPFNVQVSSRRSFVATTLSLSSVKRVAKAAGVSLNDVVMALCGTALREYLQRRRELPAQALIAAMPFSLRAKGDAEANNQVSMAQCTLATDQPDALVRLQTIAAATGRIKAGVGAMRNLIPTDFPGLAAPIWATGLSRLWGSGHLSERLPPLANLIISNVPGPALDLYLAGAHLRHCYPVSAIAHGLALNITVQSYIDQLEFGLVACPHAVPNLATIARGLGRALERLESIATDEKG